METEVRKHIRKCERCLLTNLVTPQVGLYFRDLLAFRPLELVAIDFFEIRKESRRVRMYPSHI